MAEATRAELQAFLAQIDAHRTGEIHLALVPEADPNQVGYDTEHPNVLFCGRIAFDELRRRGMPEAS